MNDKQIADDIKTLTARRREAAQWRADSQQRVDELLDLCLVRYASDAMRAKLSASRSKGRSGWSDPSVISVDELRTMLREHITKGDMIDVMNLAAMIYLRNLVDEHWNS